MTLVDQQLFGRLVDRVYFCELLTNDVAPSALAESRFQPSSSQLCPRLSAVRVLLPCRGAVDVDVAPATVIGTQGCFTNEVNLSSIAIAKSLFCGACHLSLRWGFHRSEIEKVTDLYQRGR